MQEAVSRVCSIEYKDYDDYMEKYADKPEHTMLKMLGNYFEGIGILLNRKLVDAEIVHDFWGDIIKSTWEKVRPMISDWRKDSGDVNTFKFWEYLYNQMKKREKDGVNLG
jgi:hypothetical protein